MPRGKAAAKSATAVEWSWRTDQSTWNPYDVNVNQTIEEEYQKGAKKIKIDKERFLDLSMTREEVLKNFVNLDKNDMFIIGMQRRYDDEMKRRAVRRYVPDFFSKDTFLLLSKLSKKESEELTSNLELYGGIVAKKFTKKITMVIASSADDLDKFQDEASQAVDAKIPIVTPDFVRECIAEKKKVSTQKFLVDWKPKAKDEPKKEEKKEEKKNKRKKEEDDDDEDKAPKKKKEDPKKAEPQQDAPKDNKDQPLEFYKDAPALRAGTQWMGSCTMESDGMVIAQLMIIKERQGNTFSGEIHWPTLNGAKTKFRGTINGDVITHEEYEVIQGEDEVVVPAKYIGKIAGSTLTGSLDTTDDDLKCNYKLDKLDAQPARDWDIFKQGSEWNGTVYQPYPFSFKVTSRKAGKIEGEITWPSLNNAKTKVRGKIEGDEFEFEEFESPSKDVLLPCSYISKMINKKVVGKFQHKEGSGTFEMDISK